VFTATAELYDIIYSFKDYASEAAKVRAVIEAARPGARTILEVACGTGEHAKHLARDYEVDGIDLEPVFVRIASGKGPGKFEVADMRAFELRRRYDVVQCLFSSIAYVIEPEEIVATLACFRRHLAPGGIVLVEPWLDPAIYVTGKVHMLVVDRPELKICRMNAQQREGDVSILHFHYLIGTPDGVTRAEEVHHLALVPTDRMLEHFARAGLSAILDPAGPSGRGLFVAR
jgi:SAM-dependent methyltransferase